MGGGPDQLRFVMCGSVDDGKSTLIGRLLHDTGSVPADQLAALAADSRRHGTRGSEPDFSLLLDGLLAEREQRITIDVAYRYFGTPRRRFIVADAPGHEQYTRNMVTAASTADLAVLLVDASKGLLPQTRRHAVVASLLGVRQVVLAVNKMDLVGFDERVFLRIEADFLAFAQVLSFARVTAIPVSAVGGDNIAQPSTLMPWFGGPTLLQRLESADPDALVDGPLRLPVQWVNRPNAEFRGFSGTIVSGNAQPGAAIRVLPSNRESRIARVVTADGDLSSAQTGQSVTLTLEHELDVSRGDVIVAAGSPAPLAAQFEASVIWMHESALLQGRAYLLKSATRTVSATISPVKYRIDIDTLAHAAAQRLELNELGVCELELDQPIAFEPYAVNRALGSFILIDPLTNETVGAGMFNFALRRSQNLHWQALDVNKALRARHKHQTPRVLWLTGLSGAGKSAIANLVEKKLLALQRHTYLLDGDNVRHGLNKDLGFTDQDRVENIRRVAEVARLMVDAGLIVLVSFISPFRAERRMARDLFGPGEFIEVFVDTPLTVAEQRDPKGLYAKARRGELRNFTGIDSPYEPPEQPELRIDTTVLSAEQAAEEIVRRVLAD